MLLLAEGTTYQGSEHPGLGAAAALAADAQLQLKLLEGASLLLVAVSSRLSEAETQSILEEVQQTQSQLRSTKQAEVRRECAS